jgi:hypothetical protein
MTSRLVGLTERSGSHGSPGGSGNERSSSVSWNRSTKRSTSPLASASAIAVSISRRTS